MSARPESADKAESPGIDPRGPRFGAAITTTLLLVDLVLIGAGLTAAALVLLAALVALFAWGAFAGIARHPYGILFRRLVRPRLGPPSELEDPRPPTFAQGVGLLVSAVGLVFGLVGVVPVLVVAVGAAFVAAALNAVFGLCLGCRLYLVGQRLRPARA